MQCIENCDVLPIYCPDSKCTAKGILKQLEIKHLLSCISSTSVTSFNEFDPNNNVIQANDVTNKSGICFIDCENTSCTNEKYSLIRPSKEAISSNKSEMIFERYLKLYENIGNYFGKKIISTPNKFFSYPKFKVEIFS